MDLTEAEEIKKRWQEYTEKLYKKKSLNELDNYEGVVTHLEPDILQSEVKWTLWSITMNKVSGDDGIPPELFWILKDGAVKVLHLACQQIWKTHHWSPDRKRSIFIPIPKKGNTKECSKYHAIAFISHASKEMLSSKIGFNSTLTEKFQMYKLGLEKAEGPETKLPTTSGS